MCRAQMLTANSPPTYLRFNSDLFWNTSSATDFFAMFYENTEFRGDLSTWDVRKVTNMVSTFAKAGIQDSGIGNWDVRSLETAAHMFANAQFLSTDLDLSRWNMGNCKDLSFMFEQSAIRDNSGVGNWTLHPTAKTREMFHDAAFFSGGPAAAVPAAPRVPLLVGEVEAGHSFGSRDARKNAEEDIRKMFANALREETGQETGQETGWCAVQ